MGWRWMKVWKCGGEGGGKKMRINLTFTLLIGGAVRKPGSGGRNSLTNVIQLGLNEAEAHKTLGSSFYIPFLSSCILIKFEIVVLPLL